MMKSNDNRAPRLQKLNPRFPVGTPFIRETTPCVVTDLYRTYNHAGELIRFCYVAQYMEGDIIKTDYNIHESVIVKGLIG